MGKELVKQDMNFLEYPLWFQDCRLAEQEEGSVWEHQNQRGLYVYRAGYKMPAKIDYIFLLYLLMQSQKEGWKKDLELTRYQVLRGCGMQPNKKFYERLEDSLKRWKMAGVEFRGTFYDGKSYEILNFGIINDWGLDRHTKKLKIGFNEKWLLKIRNSGFYKMINFEVIKKLRSPLVARLYEIIPGT